MADSLRKSLQAALDNGLLRAHAFNIYSRLLDDLVPLPLPQAEKISCIHIVSAANDKFWISAATLVKSLAQSDVVKRILIYDLGLSERNSAELSRLDPRVTISTALLPLVDLRYIQTYQFKIDGLFFATGIIGAELCRDSAVIWLDSGVIVHGDLSKATRILSSRDSLLCDLATRRAANGQTGVAIKAFNHLSPWDEPPETYPFSSHILTRPLSWAGIHGFRAGSDYFRNVVEQAFRYAIMKPCLISGPKFATPEARIQIEAGSIFQDALRTADEQGIVLARRGWNGARFDLFLFTCLFHCADLTLLSSQGIIEDLTDGKESRRTFNQTESIAPRAVFRPELLRSSETEFVIHRGSLGLA